MPEIDGVVSEDSIIIEYYPPGCAIHIPKPPNITKAQKLTLGPFNTVEEANKHINIIEQRRTDGDKNFNSSFSYDPHNEQDIKYLRNRYGI